MAEQRRQAARQWPWQAKGVSGGCVRRGRRMESGRSGDGSGGCGEQRAAWAEAAQRWTGVAQLRGPGWSVSAVLEIGEGIGREGDANTYWGMEN